MFMQRAGIWSALLIVCLMAIACGGGSPANTGGGGGGGQPGQRYAVYVPTDASGGEILTFIFDSGAGTLSGPTVVAGPPGGLDIKFDSVANFFYASDFNSNSVYAYTLDPHTGTLAQIAGSPFPFPGTQPPYRGNGGPLAIDPAGKFVFYSDAFGSITSFFIDASSGALHPTSSAIVNDCIQPEHFLVAPSGKFLYASNNADPSGPEFCVYSIDSGSGALTAIPGSPFSFEQNSAPWGMVTNPSGTFLYSSLSNAQKVGAFSVDTTSGALSQLTGSPYPAEFIPQGIAFGGNARFLYVGNEGTGNISIYKVDQATGELSASGSFAAGNPSVLASDSSGQYLFVRGDLAGQLSVYRIDSGTGDLSRLSSVSFPGLSNLPAVAVVPLK
jgi:6-phosphogluconolactonase